MIYENYKAIYKLEEDLSCKITFEFSEKGIKVTQESDDYNSGCSFGHAVKADGFFNKVSSEIPILKDPLTDEILD